MAVPHPAIWRIADRRPLAGPGAAPLQRCASRRPSSLDTIVTGPGDDPGAASSIQPCENASRVPGDAPGAVGPTGGVRGRASSAIRTTTRRTTTAATFAPDARRPPIRAAPAVHSGPAASFLFFMTAGFAGAGR